MDLGGNTSVRPLIQLMVALERPVAAICYGVGVLIQATDPETSVPLVSGRLVTGHSEQDDYTDFTANVIAEGEYSPNYGSAVFTLEQMIKQYTGPAGGFLSKNGTPYMAVADGPFISARTTPDGYPAALLTLARLHGADQLPEKFVIDGDGRGHEPAGRGDQAPPRVGLQDRAGLGRPRLSSMGPKPVVLANRNDMGGVAVEIEE